MVKTPPMTKVGGKDFPLEPRTAYRSLDTTRPMGPYREGTSPNYNWEYNAVGSGK